MTSRRWLPLVILPLVLTIGPARAGEAENRERLRSMTPERRAQLLDHLDQFERLGPTQQADLRAIDGQIADLPADERGRMFDLLHRYHAWLQTLSEEKRRALDLAPPEKRLQLVHQYRAEDRKSASHGSRRDLTLSRTLYPGPRPSQIAFTIRCWRALNDEDREIVLKELKPEDRAKRCGELATIYQEVQRGGRFRAEENKARQRFLSDPKNHQKLDAMKPKERERFIAQYLRHWEDDYFDEQHLTRMYEPEELVRFEESLPPWIRQAIDPLPPGAARRRLTILHDLVDSEDEEQAKPSPAKERRPVPERRAGPVPPQPPEPAPIRTTETPPPPPRPVPGRAKSKDR